MHSIMLGLSPAVYAVIKQGDFIRIIWYYVTFGHHVDAFSLCKQPYFNLSKLKKRFLAGTYFSGACN